MSILNITRKDEVICSLGFCLEVSHTTSAHISLIRISRGRVRPHLRDGIIQGLCRWRIWYTQSVLFQVSLSFGPK
jgi:hypothetical protein